MAGSQGSSASVTVDDLDTRLRAVESSLESLESSINTISSNVGVNASSVTSLETSVENLNNQFKKLMEGSSEDCNLHSLELAIDDFNATIFELVQPSVNEMNNSLTELQAFVPTLKEYSDAINTAKANLQSYQELMNYFTKLEENREKLLEKFSESENVIQTLAAVDSRLQQLTTAATKLEKMYASIANQSADATQLEQLYARNVEAVSSLSETLDELYALRASLSKQMMKVSEWVERSEQIQLDVDQKIAEMKKLQSLDLVNAVSNAISASASVAVASRHSKSAETEDNRKSL
jgi:predicted nuclease with TOPRIM domain